MKKFAIRVVVAVALTASASAGIGHASAEGQTPARQATKQYCC